MSDPTRLETVATVGGGDGAKVETCARCGANAASIVPDGPYLRCESGHVYINPTLVHLSATAAEDCASVERDAAKEPS